MLRRFGAALLLFTACSNEPRQSDGLLDEVMAKDGTLDESAVGQKAGLVVSRAAATGRFDMVRAEPGKVLAVDDATRPPGERARGFLARYGGAIGIAAADRSSLSSPQSM